MNEQARREFTFLCDLPPGPKHTRFNTYSIGIDRRDVPAGFFEYAPPAPKIVQDTLPTTSIKFDHSIDVTGGVQILSSIGICIYCGAKEFSKTTNLPPSDEHVIPEGIGGTIILRRASCNECAVKINKFEGWLQRNHFNLPRKNLKLRSKRKYSELNVPVRIPTFTSGNQGFKEEIYPIDAVPPILIMPVFDTPGAIVDRPHWLPGLTNMWLHKINSEDYFTKGSLRNLFCPTVDLVKFSQFLCKIAYSYASASFGIPQYIAEQTEPVGTKRSDMLDFMKHEAKPYETAAFYFNFVGGQKDAVAPSQHLHELGFETKYSNNKRFHLVHIRLFACLGAPIYTIIVGWENVIR